MRRLLHTAVAITSLFVVALGLPQSWAQMPVDPQSLVGEWSGSWTDKRHAGNNGQYSLTIERVVGDAVHGQVQFRAGGPSGPLFDSRFVGTLQGNRLTFGRDTKTEFSIEGTHMRGTSEGPHTSRIITVNKQK
jgi:hypothetical protein